MSEKYNLENLKNSLQLFMCIGKMNMDNGIKACTKDVDRYP
jgi:hypothetical protein